MGRIIVPSLVKPSYKTGFARNAAESANPHLWRGLVGAWIPALGVTGNILHDISAFKNHGTLVNSPTWVVSGGRWSLNFNASDSDFINIDSNTPNAYPITVFGWFKTSDASATSRTLISWGNSVDNNEIITLALTTAQKVGYLLRVGAANVIIDSADNLNDGEWHLSVAISRSATDHEFFVDGVSIATDPTDTVSFPSIDRAGIGTLRRGLNASFFEGNLGCSGIYNRALNPNEIRQLHIDPLALFRFRIRSIQLANRAELTLPQFTISSTALLHATANLTLPLLSVQAAGAAGAELTFPIFTVIGRSYKGSPPDCAVMNTKNFAVSEYEDYAFNSYARFNGANLSANQNGIYELDDTATDEGTYKIKAHIKSGEIDTYNGSIQRLRNAYLSYETDGDVQMVSRADKAATRKYYLTFQTAISGIRERRIKFERGIRNRHFDFKIENINGSSMEIDKLTVLLEPIISKRR